MPPLRQQNSVNTYRSFIVHLNEIIASFSAGGRLLFYILACLIVGSGVGLLYILNNNFLVEVPAHGGMYTEGIIGSPRFINPVLALSDADNDLTALTYSGLLKAAPDGTFIPDLADHYDVSQDGKTYTVYLRKNARFQDGTPVTVDDVVFTINEAVDPNIKSPLRANWNGVNVSELDPYTVQFSLSQPYAPFIENLTMGILPKHLWQNISAEEFPFSNLNVNPIGSGPYKVTSVSHDSSGIPSSYTLRSFSNYTLGEPYITTLQFKFYQNEKDLIAALRNNDIDAASGISPASLRNIGTGKTVLSVPLSRVFGVFFNQNQNSVLRNLDVRRALSEAVDRTSLIQTVLGGYGSVLNGPIPPSIRGAVPTATSTAGSLGTSSSSLLQATSTGNSSAEASQDPAIIAREMLLQSGWSIGSNGILQKTTGTGSKAQTQVLSLTLTTGTVPELTGAAQFLKNAWTRMGAQVSLQVFDQGDLSEQVIRPRKYDALLFGEIIGHGLDLFAFWNSSQRNDPGLNIALYANTTVDSLLTQLRQAQDDATRQALYSKLEQQIESDAPAVFLYSPDFIYVIPSNLKGIQLGFINTPSDRFNDITNWYLETDHVWTFIKNKLNSFSL